MFDPACMRHFCINKIYPMASVLFHDDTQGIFVLLDQGCTV